MSTNKHNDTLCIIYSNERTDQIHFWYFTLCYASKLRLPCHAKPHHAMPRLSSKCSLLLQFSPFQFNWMRWIEFGYIYIFTIAFSLAYTVHTVHTYHSLTYFTRLIIVFHTICPERTIFNLVLCDAPNFVCNSIYRMNWIGIFYTHKHILVYRIQYTL